MSPTPLTIVSNNVYQIAAFYVAYEKLQGDLFKIASCTQQTPRAIELGKFVKEYDVVLLQEMWGSCVHLVFDAIRSSHSVVERNVCWEGIFNTGLLADVWNTYKFNWGLNNGGLYTAVKKEINLVWEFHHTFVYKKEEEGLYKSVSYVLLDVSSKWEGKYLLTMNVHLHSPLPFGNTEARRHQRNEIKEKLIQIQSDMTFPEGFEWSNCGVIFVGDMNIGYEDPEGNITEEYLELISDRGIGVKLRDLYLETHPDSHQRSYDAENPFVGCKHDSARMDYIFALDEIPTSSGTPIPVMKVKGDCDIYFTKENEDISDHYPLTARIVPDI